MEKKQITQDDLKQFIKVHNLKLVRIAEIAGLSEGSVNSCFKHQIINNGVPRSFTRQTIAKMNEELPRLADEIAACAMQFGKDPKEVFTNQRGKTYDKALVEPIKTGVARYFNINPFLERVVGWNKTRKHNVLETNTGKAHGCITREDMNCINDELEFVSDWLMKRELVADTIGNSEPKDADSKEDNKGTGARMEQSFESNAQPWDDTSLTLQERTRLVRERWANGILFFRVNGGYTLEGDDARFAGGIDSRISPYTDAASGLTTAYMDEEVLQSVLPKMVCQEKRIVFTDMY